MARHLADIDERALMAAKSELGTAGRPQRRVALTHLVDTSVLTRLGHAPARAACGPREAGRGRKGS